MIKRIFIMVFCTITLYAENNVSIEEMAKTGNAKAQYDFAEIYKIGKERPKSIKKAFFWYQKSAIQGYAPAQSTLGVFYERGIGVKMDADKAFDLYQKSALQNFAIGQYNLGNLYRFNKKYEDHKKAFSWHKKASEQNMTYSQFRLALMYTYANGVKKDLKLAKHWAIKAMNNNHPDAKKFLVYLEDLKKREEEKKKLWSDVENILALKGDIKKGESTFAFCKGCHMKEGVSMGGVIPSSLEHAGRIYDEKFLIALINNPAIATDIDHKYPKDTIIHPMGSISFMVDRPQDVANIVAYIKAKKSGEVSAKETYIEACSRCHSYVEKNITQLGVRPKLDNKEKMKYNERLAKEQKLLASYLGQVPLDLSNIHNRKNKAYLKEFLEDPQSKIKGTYMPKVGLSEEGMNKIMEYLYESK